MFACWSLRSFLPLLLLPFLFSFVARAYYNSTADLSTKWTTTKPLWSSAFTFNPAFFPFLIRRINGSRMSFVCGMSCVGSQEGCYLGIFLPSFSDLWPFPEVVWSANRDKPVGDNATLELSAEGNLGLMDVDGSVAWSTNTTGMSVAGMNLTDTGNLELFDKNNATVWKSFDHPTDTILLGQKLKIETEPPQVYFPIWINFPNTSIQESGFASFMNSTSDSCVLSWPDSSVRYVKFEPDGHLRLCRRWDGKRGETGSLLVPYLGDCAYPTVCGTYGICSSGGQCGCPPSSDGSYFKPVDIKHPKRGCVETVPFSCENSQFHTFLEYNDIAYFTFSTGTQNTSGLLKIDKESCKEACANNYCSCKNSNILGVILSSSVGTIFGLTLLYGVVRFLALKRRGADEVEENYLEELLGQPTRFTYDDLTAITRGFTKKLGAGGFGSVFEGTLNDGTKVAVKRLDRVHQSEKSFRAEVETIGNIHHVNLVRLIGLSAEKSQRLLIYEYMCNGSLDRWIFHKSKRSFVLDWKMKRKIICDIAKGLNYLHEECNWKIIHMDIKPQNILMDENFNAKVADFGLSKLLDKDQSRAMTMMRGTPGYLAPEWLNGIITEKVDVYSFGVVVLQIVSGKKINDHSQNEEDMYLLDVFKRKAEEERLLDMVDSTSEDMRSNQSQMITMMRIAMWCMQGDFSKRPSMLTVINALDGVVEVPKCARL